MKILTLISGGDVGGAKTHVLSLLSALGKQAQIVMVCFMEAEFTHDAREMGIDTRIIPGMNLLKTSRILHDLVAKEGFDLIHSHGSRGNFMAWMLRDCGLPLLATVHSDPRLDYLGRPAAALTFGSMNRFALRRLDYLTGVSDSMAELLISRGFDPCRIFTIYNGVDLDSAAPPLGRRQFLENNGISPEENAVYVGIAARLNPVKDLSTLLRGFALAREKAPMLRLLIAGDGPQESELKALAGVLGIGDDVHFLGWQADTDSFYAALDINTLTSLSETFPYALTEGARQRCATVSSRVGGVPRLIDHGVNGYLFPAGDAEALGNCLSVLALDAGLRARFGAALYEKVARQFSLSATVETQMEIYRTVLRRRKARQSKRETIAVCGAYGRGNAGDEAILKSILQELRELAPDAPICVVSRNPKETRLTHRVQAIHTFDIPGFRRLSRRCRLYLNGGGSLIQDVTSRRSLWFYLYTLKRAKKVGVPVVMYGCGIGPVTNSADRALAGRIISASADVITLRENDSLSELQALGVSGPEVILAADPSLTLRPDESSIAEGVIRSAGLEPGKPYVCFVLRPWPGFEEKTDALAQAADRLCREEGMTPVFLAIDQGKDIAAARQVTAKMTERALVLEEPYSGEQLSDLLGAMRCVISMRLHGLIFAAGRGVPLLGIVYDPKVRAFLRYIDRENAIDLSHVTADALVQAAKDAISAASPESQQAAVAHLQELEMENRRVLRRYLGEEQG